MEGKLLHKFPLPEIDLFVIIIQFFSKCIILFEVTYINLSISGLTMSTTNSPPLWMNAFSKSVHTIGSSAIPIFHLDNLLCGSDFLQLLLRYSIKTHFNSLMFPVVMKKIQLWKFFMSNFARRFNLWLPCWLLKTKSFDVYLFCTLVHERSKTGVNFGRSISGRQTIKVLKCKCFLVTFHH